MNDSSADTTASQSALPTSSRRLIEWLLAISIIVLGAAIRMVHLDASPFWVDEAESSINALTILANGYPTDSYLGIPIYENTYTWVWPESSEYEFRDTSYSQNHFAVYHGWLPLYSIAGSFALFGVQPDTVGPSRLTKHTLHTLEDQKWRTIAGRLPAVLFGALFLLVVFLGGRALYGRDAGWTALIVASINPYHIELSRQARYYAAQVTLSTACCILLWLLARQFKWKHVYLTAVCLILLFHTHLLSFLTAVTMFVVLIPQIIRHDGWIKKIGVFIGLVAIGTLPWVVLTGFYGHPSRIPRGWTLMNLPYDLFHYPLMKTWALVTGALIAILSAWIVLVKPRVSARISSPLKQLWPVLLFLSGWAICGYVVFITCMPAVSFTNHRLNLSYWGPLLLLGSAMIAAITRTFAERASIMLAPALALLLFICTGHDLGPKSRDGASWPMYSGIFKEINSRKLASTTRIYSVPNEHLVLTFYSGLPIQDISPVRKSFLDSYPDDIFFIDSEVSVDTGILSPALIREAALRHGQKLSAQAARQWFLLLATRRYRERMTRLVAPDEVSQFETLPSFAAELLSAHDSKIESFFAVFDYQLLARNFKIQGWSDWVAVLKFRYVDPESRRGIHANYAERLRGAETVMLDLPQPVAIYYSRRPPQPGNTYTTFRIQPMSPRTPNRS